MNDRIYPSQLEPKLAEKLKSRNISFDQTNIGGTFSNNQSVHINSQNCHIEPDISTIQNSVQAPQQPPLQERTARTIYMGTARTNPTKVSIEWIVIVQSNSAMNDFCDVEARDTYKLE